MEMTNTNFIKWLCVQAGWKIRTDEDGDQFICLSSRVWFHIDLIGDNEEIDLVYYPLLLRLAADNYCGYVYRYDKGWRYYLEGLGDSPQYYKTENEAYETGLKEYMKINP